MIQNTSVIMQEELSCEVQTTRGQPSCAKSNHQDFQDKPFVSMLKALCMIKCIASLWNECNESYLQCH